MATVRVVSGVIDVCASQELRVIYARGRDKAWEQRQGGRTSVTIMKANIK